MRHEKRRDRWSGAEWRVEEEEVKDQLFSRTWGDGEEKKKKREKRKSEKREDFCTALCPHFEWRQIVIFCHRTKLHDIAASFPLRSSSVPTHTHMKVRPRFQTFVSLWSRMMVANQGNEKKRNE